MGDVPQTKEEDIGEPEQEGDIEEGDEVSVHMPTTIGNTESPN